MAVDPKEDPEGTQAVRVKNRAMKWVKRACGYTDETFSEFVSRAAEQVAKAEVQRLHAEAIREAEESETPPGPKRPKGPKRD